MRLSECYSLLELSPGASLDEIKTSYRKLAFKYHPDLNPGDARAAARFTRLNEAYVLLKKHRESTPGSGSAKRVYSAETIRQEEEAKARPGTGRKQSAFYTRQEEVLKDILNDPFAKQVFEDIFSKLKRGVDPADGPRTGATAHPSQEKPAREVGVKWGGRSVNLDVGAGLLGSIKGWAARQLDDHQTVYMPARNLIPGTTLRVQIRHRFQSAPRTIEVVLPMDFVVGRPIRLKGLGRHLGPWHGDLYLRLLARASAEA
ncbi:MAG: molecular chaperone DnaJ [Deltaproteobacteria bacterium]|nr:molecular chaperone DnaJ [Deltaproteobacteria bacterium]